MRPEKGKTSRTVEAGTVTTRSEMGRHESLDAAARGSSQGPVGELGGRGSGLFGAAVQRRKSND